MRKIISSIDIGSDYIKLVVGEFIGDRLYILSANKTQTRGMDGVKIIDSQKLSDSIRKCVLGASQTLGIEIKKVILGINSFNTKLVKSIGAIKVTNDTTTVTGDEITEVIKKCAEGKVDIDYSLVGVIPIEFLVDGDRVTNDPKGLISENLALKGIVVTSPSDYVNNLINIVEVSGLKVVDIVPNCIGDYYAFKSFKTEENIGAVISLGNETTSVSIFNKGILTNTKTYKVGAKNIVRDIAYINRVNEKVSGAIYKDLVLASSKLANTNEYRLVTNLDGKQVKINQYEVSEIAESRIEEILNLAKKQINVLTKKEISYIIISGGLSELRDFNLVYEKVFGKEAKINELDLMGVRDNSFASAVGIIKYFDKKVLLRGKTFSIFSEIDLKEMNEENNKTSVNNNSLLGKVFGYFFDS